MVSFMKYVSAVDTLGEPVQLNFRGQNRYRTARGGFLTMISYLCVLLLGLELFQRFYLQQDPIVTRYEKRHEAAKRLNLW